MAEDLKTVELSLEERAAEVVKNLGIDGTERSVVRGLKKGDVFTLTQFTPITVNKKRDGFQPMMFQVSNGASIGTKHFGNIVFDEDDAPSLGSTVNDNALFFVYCVENKIEFRCKGIKEEAERPVEGSTTGETYIPKTYLIELV